MWVMFKIKALDLVWFWLHLLMAFFFFSFYLQGIFLSSINFFSTLYKNESISEQ